MNYRHRYHAGNFADVFKHTLLIQLVRGLQRKQTPLLLLDTHAGRGAYDLSTASMGDTLARTPEWPDGVGRILAAERLPEALEDYRRLILAARTAGGDGALPYATENSYPGSPWLLRMLAREQDRLAFCELHAEEHEALDILCAGRRRQSVQLLDGYKALDALLPPPERRCLALIDPPYEAQDEFRQVVDGLQSAFRKFPSGTYAVWYPITERARVTEFYDDLGRLRLPPCWTVELNIVGAAAARKLKGCGLLVFNPPWQLDQALAPLCPEFSRLLGQDSEASCGLHWVVGET